MKNLIKVALLVFPFLIVILHSCKKEELPTLSTSTITNITVTSASSGGIITSDGGASITARGICWSLNLNPTISDSKTVDGKGNGQFMSNLTGLVAGSTYHVRAYATNSVGTAYGADLSFATLGKAPECMTQPATNITPVGATLNGMVNANYISTTVTFEYGTTSTYGQTITATQSPVTGNSLTNVTADLTGLVAGTTYHFRLKTVNSLGTTNGNDLPFITAGQTPTAITQAACCLSSTGAKLNGTVNANYLSTTVTFEYGLTTAYGSPVTAIPSPVTGNTNTNVSANISGLIPGTTYHFRIKALNELGTTYGEDLTFITLPVIPTVTTAAISSVTYNSAVSGGNITSDGGAIVTARGVCWGTNANPTTSESHTIDVIGTGSFTSNMKCLIDATTYYVRAYATNSAGTAYGNQVSFPTEISPIAFNPNLIYGTVSDIDENCYKTIQIGTQTWMAENLRTTKYNDGNNIASVTNSDEWKSTTSGAYCWYNNESTNYENVYGKLYNWYAVGTGKLCPVGWHVPELREWKILCTISVNDPCFGSNLLRGDLIETGTTHWINTYPCITNETGFTALPGGHRTIDGFFTHINGFSSIGTFGYFWSSTDEGYPSLAERWRIPYFMNDGQTPMMVLEDQNNGLSIRCVKD